MSLLTQSCWTITCLTQNTTVLKHGSFINDRRYLLTRYTVCALYTRVECSSVNKSRGWSCELLYYKAASARGRRVVISHNFSFRTPVQSRQQRNNKRKAVKATVTAGSAVKMRKHGYQPYRKSRAYLIVPYLTCFNCLNPPPFYGRPDLCSLLYRLSLSFTRLFNKTGNQRVYLWSLVCPL